MKEEILAKLKEAKSAEDFIAITKESGRELTAEQARELYNRLHGGGELSDDDLANVAGGFFKLRKSDLEYFMDPKKYTEYTVTIPY